jgi:hypothetical protein
MSANAPPVPPKNSNDKEKTGRKGEKLTEQTQRPNANAEGRADNIKQNTTHQGHQQDR